MQMLTQKQSENVRAGRVDYGMTERDTLKRRAICRCCGEQMAKGTSVIRFAWDFQSGGTPETEDGSD